MSLAPTHHPHGLKSEKASLWGVVLYENYMENDGDIQELMGVGTCQSS